MFRWLVVAIGLSAAASPVFAADPIEIGIGYLGRAGVKSKLSLLELPAENDGFAAAVVAAGLAWIGPPASAIRAMGLKSASKALMEKAGVPLTPGYHGGSPCCRSSASRRWLSSLTARSPQAARSPHASGSACGTRW